MSHIANIAAAAESLNSSAAEARAAIPSLHKSWMDACAAHEAVGAAAQKTGDYSACRASFSKMETAQRALNAAQWAAGERWNLVPCSD